VKTREGTIRLIDAQAGKRCGAGESVVTWNQAGPRGATGAEGAAGASGPAGPAGPAGAFVLKDGLGNSLGTIASDNGGWFVVWDGTAFRSYDAMGRPAYNSVLFGGIGYDGPECTGNEYVTLSQMAANPYQLDVKPFVIDLRQTPEGSVEVASYITAIGDPQPVAIVSARTMASDCFAYSATFPNAVQFERTGEIPIPPLPLTVAPNG
jgi:hypothetical protein